MGKTLNIGLKTVEIGLLIAATAFVTYFVNKQREDKTKGNPEVDPLDLGVYGRHEFFLYTTTIGVILAIAFIVDLVNGADEEKPGKAYAMFVVHLLWAVQMLTSTSMLGNVLRAYEKKNCEIWDKEDEDYQCNQVIGGVGCGFLAAVLFFVDTVIYYKSYKRSL